LPEVHGHCPFCCCDTQATGDRKVRQLRNRRLAGALPRVLVLVFLVSLMSVAAARLKRPAAAPAPRPKLTQVLVEGRYKEALACLDRQIKAEPDELEWAYVKAAVLLLQDLSPRPAGRGALIPGAEFSALYQDLESRAAGDSRQTLLKELHIQTSRPVGTRRQFSLGLDRLKRIATSSPKGPFRNWVWKEIQESSRRSGDREQASFFNALRFSQIVPDTKLEL